MALDTTDRIAQALEAKDAEIERLRAMLTTSIPKTAALITENKQMRAALLEVSKDCELDPVLLKYVPTRAAIIATDALNEQSVGENNK